MALRGVLIDFYGTLVHEDDAVISLICEEIRRTAAVEATAREIGRYWWTVFVPLCDQSRGRTFLTQRETGLRSLAETVRHFRSSADPEVIIQPQFAHWRAPPIFPDTIPFLRCLSEHRIPVCIVSYIERIDIEAAIASHDLTVDGLITSDDARAYKPHPEMFDLGLKVLGVEPSDVLLVGDSLSNDVAGANALGIPVAWLNRTDRPAADGARADHVATDLTDLMRRLRPRIERLSDISVPTTVITTTASQ